MDFKEVAEQLHKPEGELGKQVGEKMNHTNEIMNLSCIRLLTPESNDTILEIGMGNGLFCKYLLGSAPRIRYTGCDFSETMIQEATQVNQSFVETGQAHFLLGDAMALPLADNLFTKAFTVNTLYFWQDPPKVLAEIRRVLQPGGKLLIAIRSKEVMQHLPFVSFGFHLYSPDEVSELLSQNGFAAISIHEIPEPEQTIHGQVLKMDSVIISGVRVV
ncbi:class I SAM-dependent methyltransferase [Cytophagaceae bacterium YF14B1]|uniref:Class I SAM-dependent methyltransferase n=1 Tax=Xanthocytophaga flava TaxID=3048013 RepID=A0AAE3R0I3_9BACT|nr:class I SAM-dependent methyltransferase [Xanthocytophaga flavus]MDJ1486084.1 class I SAM-dependent methyltransferase [Xanthocytophaga flavus]